METPIIPAPRARLPARRVITVFGASWCTPDDARPHARALYDESVSLGAAIATAGFELVNGGYSGTMEGTARGARAAVASAATTGVIVPKLFPHRSNGNEYLTTTVPTGSLLQRIENMIDRSDYFIVMPGTLGTLTELCVVWNIAALSELAHLPRPVILCYRDPWERVVTSCAEALHIPPAHAAAIVYVDGHADAMAYIAKDVASREPSAA